MKIRNLFVICCLAILFLPGCGLIASIFKLGFWTAIILIVLIVGLIIYGAMKLVD